VPSAPARIGLLDFLDPEQIPAEQRFDGQPKEWVGFVPHVRSQRHPWTEAQTVSLSFSADRRLVAGLGRGGFVYVWEGADGDELVKLAVPPAVDPGLLVGSWSTTEAVALSPDGTSVAVLGQHKWQNMHDYSTLGWVQVWDWKADGLKAREVLTCEGAQSVKGVALSSSGKLLATAEYVDSKVRLWEIQEDKATELANLRRGDGDVRWLAFAPDGNTLVVGSPKEIRLWDLSGVFHGGWRSVRLTRYALGIVGSAGALAVLGLVLLVLKKRMGARWNNPSLRPKWLTRFLAVAGAVLAVCVGAWTWNYFRSGVAKGIALERTSGDVNRLGFTGNGQFLVAATDHGPLTVWDAVTGKIQQEWKVPWNVEHATLAADGRHLIAEGKAGSYVLRLHALDESEHLLPCCETILKQDPRNIDALLARGELRFKKGEHDAAVSDFTEVIRLAPQNAAAYYGRGLAQAEKGDFARAKADLEKAIQINPELGQKKPGAK
jgi:hypothetical protein